MGPVCPLARLPVGPFARYSVCRFMIVPYVSFNGLDTAVGQLARRHPLPAASLPASRATKSNLLRDRIYGHTAYRANGQTGQRANGPTGKRANGHTTPFPSGIPHPGVIDPPTMKIALIASPYPLEEAPSPPLGLCYAAAACEAAGAQVIILDYIVSQYTPEKLAAALDAFQPDVVGTNSVTMNFKGAIKIMQDVKAHRPEIITMMGGPHVSFDAPNTLTRYPELDLIVIGEGEATLAELIPVIQSRPTWHDIRGIAFRDKGRVITTPSRPPITDLGTLPLPARHLLPVSRYLALGFPVSIITSRGCPNKCIFCQGRRMVGHKPRFRSAKVVVDEIEHILSYGFTWINVADDLFTASKRRVKEVCDEILRRGVKFVWSAFARVNTVDPEMLAMMKAAGCDSIGFGVESGNQGILDLAQKGITKEQIQRAVAWSKEAGLRVHASFIVGLPGESPETLAETSAFAQALDVDYGYHLLSPFPGTTIKEDIHNYDLEILTEDWDRYDANQAIVRSSRLSPQQMDAFVAALYQEHEAKTREAEARYQQGQCPPEELIWLEAGYRLKLVFALLSKDLIDGAPLKTRDHGDPAAALIAHVLSATQMNPSLVQRTVSDLIQKGYVKYKTVPGGINWYWTHNCRQETFALAS